MKNWEKLAKVYKHKQKPKVENVVITFELEEHN